MNIDILIYEPGQMEPTESQITISGDVNYSKLNETLRRVIGQDTLHIEHVSVLFRGARHDMYVDEFSAVSFGKRGPLPVNDAATKIYHEASRSQGKSVEDAPRIHGRAVITLQRTWY